MFCAERRKFLEELPDFRFALQPLAVRGSGQQAGLREVRENIIRPAAERRHLLDKREIKAGVERTVVRHRGVNNSETAGREERIHNLLHNRNLSPASEIARINRIKGNVLFLPLCGNFRHILGQIPEGKAVEICAGVIGEHRRGENTGLHAAGRDDGQGHGERALSHTGNVLYCQYFLISCHYNASFCSTC